MLANSANAVNPAMAAVCNVFLIIVPRPLGRAIFVRLIHGTSQNQPDAGQSKINLEMPARRRFSQLAAQRRSRSPAISNPAGGTTLEMLRLHSGWQASVFRQFATVLGVGNHDIAVVGPRMWEPRAIKHVERNR